MNREKVQELVDGYYAALRNRNLDDWLELFASDIIAYTPVGAPGTEGHDGMRLAFKTITGTFKKIDIQVESMFFGGSTAAVKWTARGLGHNDENVTFEGINVFEVDIQGKIWRIHAYWDPEAMMRQLDA